MMSLKSFKNAVELFPKSSEPIKSIMLNEINGAAGLASPQAPSLRLKLPLSSKWLAFFEGMKDESGYKSLGSSRWIRRREEKVNWMYGGKE
jgi:hypothetical protein